MVFKVNRSLNHGSVAVALCATFGVGCNLIPKGLFTPEATVNSQNQVATTSVVPIATPSSASLSAVPTPLPTAAPLQGKVDFGPEPAITPTSIPATPSTTPKP